MLHMVVCQSTQSTTETSHDRKYKDTIKRRRKKAWKNVFHLFAIFASSVEWNVLCVGTMGYNMHKCIQIHTNIYTQNKREWERERETESVNICRQHTNSLQSLLEWSLTQTRTVMQWFRGPLPFLSQHTHAWIYCNRFLSKCPLCIFTFIMHFWSHSLNTCVNGYHSVKGYKKAVQAIRVTWHLFEGSGRAWQHPL